MLFRAVISTLLLTLLTFLPVVSEARKDTKVKGHVRKGGTFVPPHNRTSPNKSKLDNYGTKGMVNPRNGKVGKDNLFSGKGKRQ